MATQYYRLTEEFNADIVAKAFFNGHWFYQLEDTRTNLINYNRQFNITSSGWTLSELTVTPDLIKSPSKIYGADADKLIPSTAVAAHSAAQSISFTSGTYYTFGVFAKAGEYDGIRILFPDARFTGYPYATFDLSAGTVATNEVHDSGIERLRDGWFFCWMSALSDSTGSGSCMLLVYNGGTSFAGDAHSGVFAWNAQVEAGAYPSSPIETFDSSVTRPRDIMSWADGDFNANFGVTKHSIKVIPARNSISNASALSGVLYQLYKASDDYIYLHINDSDIARVVKDDGSPTVLVQSAALTFSRGKPITITLDPEEGEMIIEGADSGNGTYNGTEWASLTMDTDSTFYLGNASVTTWFLDGLVTIPYLDAKDIVEYLAVFGDGTFVNPSTRKASPP